MLTIVFAVSLVSVFSLEQENIQKNNIEASAFSSGSGTQSDPYWITTYNNWRDFVSAVANGNSYSGKYINLGYNVDWFGNSVLPIGCLSTGSFSGTTTIFKGKFDGKGRTISNFTLKAMTYSDAIDYDVNLKVNGLFGIIGDGAEIKNLSVNNFKVQMPTGGGIDNIYVGGLVGQYSGSSSATIKNCEIKNLEIIKSSGVTNYNKYIGAIIGRKASYGSLTIQDCYVENFKVSLSDEDWYVDYTIAKVGPAFCTYRGSSNVKNCLVNGSTISTSSSSDTTTYQIADAPSGYLTITSCYTSKQTSYSGWSIGSTGGSSGTTWYYDSSYNSGWPKLRVFIDWNTINFSVSPSEGGSVYPNSVQVPSDASFTPTVSGSVITIMGQAATATPSTNYEFTGWTASTYTANFKLKTHTLSFNNATGTSGDSISPSGTSYTIYHGEPITASHTSGTGPLTLKYTFKNTSGTTCNVTYTIPAKYKLVNSNNPRTITGAVTITPTVEIKTFDIVFTISEGAELGTGSTETFNKQTNAYTIENVEYGTKITFVPFETGVTFLLPVTLTPSQMTYKIDTENYAYKGTKLDFSSISDINLTTETQNIIITDTLSIEIKNNKLYNLTFKPATNTTLTTNTGEEITEAITMKVESGKGITTTYVSNILTYIINLDIITLTYTPDKFYRIEEYPNIEKITADCEVQPTATFYACIVTMGNIDSNIGTRTITGDSYGDSEDGIFAVEFDTTVNFTIDTTTGLFKYTYTFSSGEVVTYTITNEQYAMQYTLDSNGERTSISNGLNGAFNEDSHSFAVGTTSKNISPEFGLKQYAGELN